MLNFQQLLPNKLDSLLASLSVQPQDTNRVKTLIKISEEFNLSDSRQALHFGLESFRLSSTIKWKKGEAMACGVIGSAYYNQGNFPNALSYRLKELNLWKSLSNRRNVCTVLANIGVAYSDVGDNLRALQYYLSSLALAKEVGMHETTVICLGNIGIIYESQGDSAKALEYYGKALDLAQEKKFENFVAINNGNIGSVLLAKKLYSRSLEHYKIALQIDMKNGVVRNISGWLANIGSVYQQQADSALAEGNTDLFQQKSASSLASFQKALQGAVELGDRYMESYINGSIGLVYVTIRSYSFAEKHLAQSLAIAKEIQSVELRKDAHENFYRLYKETQQPLRALEHFEKYAELKDSVSEERNKKTLRELQIKYDTEKKEEENKNLLRTTKIQELTISNDRYFLTVLIALICLILLGGVFLVRQNRLKSRAVAIGLEQKLLRSQMNPHFIFNSLANIESFIYERQPEVAALYLTQFSRLMRLILENSTKEYISIQKETETLEYYLSLQKLRLNDNLDYELYVDDAIDKEEVFLPPMLTQPFIENSIEHGFRGIKQTGRVSVSFTLKGDTLQVEITDNGIGIVQAKEQKDLHKIHQSMAMKITEERLRFLNKSKGRKLYFTVTDLMDAEKINTGTRVVFSIPLINNL